MSDIFNQLYAILDLLGLPKDLPSEVQDNITQGGFYEVSYCNGDIRLKNCEGEIYKYDTNSTKLELLSVLNETSTNNIIHLTKVLERDKSKYSHPVKYNFCGYEVYLDFTDLGHIIHALNVIKRDSGVCIAAPVKIEIPLGDIDPRSY